MGQLAHREKSAALFLSIVSLKIKIYVSERQANYNPGNPARFYKLFICQELFADD
jgi:hypothetical protein